jgi:hypothetical protein
MKFLLWVAMIIVAMVIFGPNVLHLISKFFDVLSTVFEWLYKVITGAETIKNIFK